MLEWSKINQNTIRNSFERLMNEEKPNKTLIGSMKALQKLSEEKLIESNTGKPPLKINDCRNYAEVIEVIYRIRCNLFHGNKNPDKKRDMLLIRFSTQALEKWVGNIHLELFRYN
ncbi:MAG: hypothetical protein AAB655_01870 [Patescibacteria group bacterium]